MLNKDIGFVKKNQHVAIKLDTFDFQKYGTLDGTVNHIDVDARVPESNKSVGQPPSEPSFTVYITPLKDTIRIEGQDRPLTSGLTVSSEIKIGKRRIIEFFIYPLIKHWQEGLSVR